MLLAETTDANEAAELVIEFETTHPDWHINIARFRESDGKLHHYIFVSSEGEKKE